MQTNTEHTTHHPLAEVARAAWGELTTPANWIAVLAVIAVYVVIGRLDEIRSYQHEWEQSDVLKREQATRIAQEARRRAAQALCNSSNGPNVLAVWSDSNTVECLSNHGRRVARFSMEALNVAR